MPLSWNEIKSRALAFSNEWKDEANEDAEAKTFWDDFLILHSPNETKRIEFLFELYDIYTAGMFAKEKKGRKK